MTKINTDLYQYGTNITIPYLAGTTLDYGLQNGGPLVQKSIYAKSNSLTISTNATFYDLNHPRSEVITPALFDPTDLHLEQL